LKKLIEAGKPHHREGDKKLKLQTILSDPIQTTTLPVGEVKNKLGGVLWGISAKGDYSTVTLKYEGANGEKGMYSFSPFGEALHKNLGVIVPLEVINNTNIGANFGTGDW